MILTLTDFDTTCWAYKLLKSRLGTRQHKLIEQNTSLMNQVVRTNLELTIKINSENVKVKMLDSLNGIFCQVFLVWHDGSYWKVIRDRFSGEKVVHINSIEEFYTGKPRDIDVWTFIDISYMKIKHFVDEALLSERVIDELIDKELIRVIGRNNEFLKDPERLLREKGNFAVSEEDIEKNFGNLKKNNVIAILSTIDVKIIKKGG